MREGRRPDELRPVAITRGYTEMTPGSVLIEMGKTRVLCTASLEERVPPWLRDTGKGWVTAEYAMLPGSSRERIHRRSIEGGRTKEIQRLIGRALRAVVDMEAMGEVAVRVDCDVLQADGGTRTAAISVGIVGSELLLDLPYEEDAGADVDLNVVMTGGGGLIEVQGTAEGEPFARDQLDRLLDLAAAGIDRLVVLQREALEG